MCCVNVLLMLMLSWMIIQSPAISYSESSKLERKRHNVKRGLMRERLPVAQRDRDAGVTDDQGAVRERRIDTDHVPGIDLVTEIEADPRIGIGADQEIERDREGIGADQENEGEVDQRAEGEAIQETEGGVDHQEEGREIEEVTSVKEVHRGREEIVMTRDPKRRDLVVDLKRLRK